MLVSVMQPPTSGIDYAAGIRLWTGRGSGASFFNDRCVLDWW